MIVHLDDWTAPAVELPGLRGRKYDLIMVRLVAPLTDQHLADDMNVECLFNDPVGGCGGQAQSMGAASQN